VAEQYETPADAAGQAPSSEWRELGLLLNPDELIDHMVSSGDLPLPGDPANHDRPNVQTRAAVALTLKGVLHHESAGDVVARRGKTDPIDVANVTREVEVRDNNVRALLAHLVEAYGGKIVLQEGER